MDAAQVIDLGRESLWIAVKVAAPLLGVALAIGLLVGGSGYWSAGRDFAGCDLYSGNDP